MPSVDPATGFAPPIVYPTVAERHLVSLNENAGRFADSLLADVRRQTVSWIKEGLTTAYARGVADGFAQGVAAEARRKEVPS